MGLKMHQLTVNLTVCSTVIIGDGVELPVVDSGELL
jgi:hypothetical protein